MTEDGARMAHAGIDLEALRMRLAEASDADRLQPLGLGRVVAGPDALDSLPEVVTALLGTTGGELALLADATPMRRGEQDLKPRVRGLLVGSGFSVREVRVGPDSGHAHADEETLAAVQVGAEGAVAIISVGSGTVADIGKTTAHELGGLPHVVVQTAASVNGFADDQSVLLKNGVKRTTPSRWPDVLLLDGAILRDAPAAMNQAGLGDLVSMFTATPDWYLAREVGMDASFSATATALGRDHGEELLALAPELAGNDSAAVVRLAEILAVSGISMGVAGRTAPSSGMEHTVSHLLEMAAEQNGWETALHGAKVGVTTIVAALTWRHVQRRIADHGMNLLFPAAEEMEQRVRAAFDALDPSGAMGEECWSDYKLKLATWHEQRPTIERFAARWQDHLAAIDSLMVEPGRIVEAMATMGAPVRFSELDPAIDAETARWAVGNCHLMRNRFTVADLACFTGAWEDADVDEVLGEAADLGAGL
jgi:glycerol-1-phosphate dehydrogenase [NAD(P)+]